MPEITKDNLSEYVKSALIRSGIDTQLLPSLPLAILQSGSIKLSKPIQRSNEFLEMVVIGRSSSQALRTSGNQVNVFAFSSVLLSAASDTPTVIGAATLLVALLGACSISLTPEQATFFVTAEALEKENVTPTAKAFASRMGTQLKIPSYSPQDVIVLALQLQRLGVPLTIGDLPNNVIRHREWTVSIPGF